MEETQLILVLSTTWSYLQNLNENNLFYQLSLNNIKLLLFF